MFIPFNQSRYHIANGRKVGSVPIGTILYLQDGLRPLNGFSHSPIICNPWIIVAWLPTVCAHNSMASSRIDRAVVKSLRDGRTQIVYDWFIRAHDDAGLCR